MKKPEPYMTSYKPRVNSCRIETVPQKWTIPHTTRFPVAAEVVGMKGLVRSCAPNHVFELPVSMSNVTRNKTM